MKVNFAHFFAHRSLVSTAIAIAVVSLAPISASAQPPGHSSITELFAPAHRGIVVVAHRGCHQPAPARGFGYEPENSLPALEHCVAMGVDMMETDVRTTADGYLVMVHDDSVDRTTNGHGRIADMTLAEVRTLRLRQDLGGYAESLTNERIPTLDEMLRAAKGRITLNLDVKDSIYAEVVDAVVRAGATDLVTVKTRAGIASPPLAAIEPFARLPFIAILDPRGSEITAVAERQIKGANLVALELPHMDGAELPKIVSVARQHGIKLASNTLGDGFLLGLGGDHDALLNPDAVWGRQYRAGISVFQTDQPEALLRYKWSLH